MKIWILLPIEDLQVDPWETWMDRVFGFVIRAETEFEARKFAREKAGEEVFKSMGIEINPWLHPDFTTCQELLPEGDPGILMKDFRRG